MTSAISGPAVAVDRAGRLTVYVRDSRRTLRARAQETPDGAFGAWQDLGGTGLQGDPVTATDTAGRRHVYAATTGSVLAWVERTPGGPVGAPEPTGLPQTTGVLSAGPEADGVRLYFRRPGTGTVTTTVATADGVAPTFSPVAEAGGQAGYGAVGFAGRLLAGRAATGTIGLASPDGPNGQAWQESRMLYTGAPAGVAGSAGGAPLAAALGLDAELHVVTGPPATSPAETENGTGTPAGAGSSGSLPAAPWVRAVPPSAVTRLP